MPAMSTAVQEVRDEECASFTLRWGWGTRLIVCCWEGVCGVLDLLTVCRSNECLFGRQFLCGVALSRMEHLLRSTAVHLNESFTVVRRRTGINSFLT